MGDSVQELATEDADGSDVSHKASAEASNAERDISQPDIRPDFFKASVCEVARCSIDPTLTW
jgi:hypothetical protein